MEEIDYKHSIELLNKDVDACLEIIDNWKKNCAYLVSIGVMPPDQWGVPLVEKLVPYERYDVVYHCNPATGDKILDRYILKNGYELYSIDFSCRSNMTLAKRFKTTLVEMGVKRLTVKSRIRIGEVWTKELSDEAELNMRKQLF